MRSPRPDLRSGLVMTLLYLLLPLFYHLSPLQAESGLTTAEFLRRETSARAAALAGAITALPSELDSLGSNPAGLAILEENSLLTSYTNGFSGTDNFGFIAWGTPRLDPLKAAAGLSYFDAGSIDLNLSNGTRETRKAEQDWSTQASLAMNISPDISLGASAKIFRLSLAEEFKANSMAFDFGGLYERDLPGPWGKIFIGASLINLGGSVTFLNDADPLPTKQALGLAWQKELNFKEDFEEQNNGYQLRILASYSQTKKEDPLPSFGLEIHKSSITGENDWGALRLGFEANGVASKPSFGFGWGWAGTGIDYAAVMIPQGAGFTHQITLRFVF